MPAWLAHLLPLIAALVLAIETGAMVLVERRQEWGMRWYVVAANLFGLAVMLYLGVGLGRPVSSAGALTIIYIAVRAIVGLIASRHRRKLRPRGGE